MRRIILAVIFVFVFSFSSFGQDQKPKIPDTGTGTGNGTGLGLGNGRGSGNGTGTGTNETVDPLPKPALPKTANSGMRILSKPRAEYTDGARQNQVQGRVVLRVTFLKTGEIGKVKVIAGLPNGLTQNAVDAAKKMKFEPQLKNSKPMIVTKNVEYSFTLY